MTTKVLVIGASGRVGSQVVAELQSHGQGIELRVATSRPQQAEQWRDEGRDAVVLDLNDPQTFPGALKGVDRVFLLTGYTSDMLYQSKKLTDAAVEAQVKHIVHLGVFSCGCDSIPHFTWHDLVETYIKASGIAWTNIHPNVIAESILDTKPSMQEASSFTIFSGDTPQGWVFVEDIAQVSAAVLREGPAKHASADYWLSTEVLTGSEVADVFSRTAGRKISCNYVSIEEMASRVAAIPSASVRSYMESAVITMKLTAEGKMLCQTTVRDDVMKVIGRPGITMGEWAKRFFAKANPI